MSERELLIIKAILTFLDRLDGGQAVEAVIHAAAQTALRNQGEHAPSLAELRGCVVTCDQRGWVTEIHGDDKQEALKPNYEYPGLEVYDLTIKGPLPQDYLGVTQAPGIVDDGSGHVMLSCGDNTAAIYYTLDGSEPMPPANEGEPTSVKVYGGPFAVAAGATVKVIAWNKVRLPSGTMQAVVSF